MTLEVLHRALVLERRLARWESAQVAPPACLSILVGGIQPVRAGRQFANHNNPSALKNPAPDGGGARPPAFTAWIFASDEPRFCRSQRDINVGAILPPSPLHRWRNT